MSVEQARKMIERLKTDEAFKARVMAIADLDGRLKLAVAEGFDCTKDELASVASELTESDLDTVSAAGRPLPQECSPKLCSHRGPSRD